MQLLRAAGLGAALRGSRYLSVGLLSFFLGAVVSHVFQLQSCVGIDVKRSDVEAAVERLSGTMPWAPLNSTESSAPSRGEPAPSVLAGDPLGSRQAYLGGGTPSKGTPPKIPSCTYLRQIRERYLDFLLDPSDEGRNWLRIGELDAELVLPLIEGAERTEGTPLVMLDIGSNTGQTSAAMMRFVCGGACSRKSPCATLPASQRPVVLAFEPQSAPMVELQSAALHGKWAACGWRAVPSAVSDREGTMALFGVGQQASLSADATLGTTGFAAPQSVVVTTVDRVVADNGWASLFLLKIDTEGMDPFVLVGARASLAARVPRFIVFEYNSKWTDVAPLTGGSGITLRNVTESLRRYGYLCYLVTNAGLLPLSGAWWSPQYEIERWSNVFCAGAEDAALEVALLRANRRIPITPVASCFEGGAVQTQLDDAHTAAAGGEG